MIIFYLVVLLTFQANCSTENKYTWVKDFLAAKPFDFCFDFEFFEKADVDIIGNVNIKVSGICVRLEDYIISQNADNTYTFSARVFNVKGKLDWEKRIKVAFFKKTVKANFKPELQFRGFKLQVELKIDNINSGIVNEIKWDQLNIDYDHGSRSKKFFKFIEKFLKNRVEKMIKKHCPKFINKLLSDYSQKMMAFSFIDTEDFPDEL